MLTQNRYVLFVGTPVQLMLPLALVLYAVPARTSMEPNDILLNEFVQLMAAAAGLAMPQNASATSNGIRSFRVTSPQPRR